MKRLLAILCTLAMMLSVINPTVFAAENSSLQAAVDNNIADIIVLEEDASNITVNRDTTIDLNGHNIDGVTVLAGTLYCMDSATADYTVADGIYGKVTNVTGTVKAAEGYLQVGESFHRVNLDIYAMTLRAANVGVYYKSRFAADEVVAELVESYGVALSVVTAPNASNLETYCGYSEFTGFEAGEGANAATSSTLLKNIMKASNTDAKNGKNAAMPVYGRAYIKTAEGYYFGETVKRSLQEQVEAIDGAWEGLSDKQKSPVLGMLEDYASVMENWNIPNIQGVQTPGVDTEIEMPIEVTTENGVVTEAVTVEQSGVAVTVPAGTKLAEDASALTLTVTPKETSDAGLTLEESEVLMPMDVHVDGLAADNAAPLTIYLGKVMAENLNMGNYTVYHVENGNANEMVLIPVDAEFTAHNQYKYTLDGELTLYMATFSEVAVVSNEVNAWNGDRNYTWYDAEAETLYIRNADQLAGFGAIVGGMDGQTEDSFAGKTVVLTADISIGDLTSENGYVFYPIGYYNNYGGYQRVSGVEVSAWFKPFEGTFDGNGNTISDFYQNTWEMFGDYNDGYPALSNYYREGMGLFGKVYGGTVKNLTVKNFSCDSEHGTSGVIASYADCGATFENIAIFNCNPRVYNIGNGGIVGCSGWYAKETAEDKVTFRNITVDNTNKISALWDATGTSAGGILGQYYPTSGQTSAGKPANPGIHFENCRISAIIEVNNDCCSNYHYYWYRYAGMLMGSVRANKVDEETGYTMADTTGITAESCVVSYGYWNEFWYCELVKNTIASYTHDHQFGRLTSITSISEISDDNGQTFKKQGDFALLDENRNCVDCYHIFKNSEGNLYRHFHDVADETNPEVYEDVDVDGDGVKENVLKEDRQRYCLPFNQLLTGDGMGILANYEFTDAEGNSVEIVEADEEGIRASQEKFQKVESFETSITTGTELDITDIFAAKADANISAGTIHVYVSPVGEDSTVEPVAYVINRGFAEGHSIAFNGIGAAKITITDYWYCVPTVINISVNEEKFTVIENVGKIEKEEGTTVGELFAAVEGAEIDNDNVTVMVNDTEIDVGENWNEASLNFPTAGEHTVTITDGNNCVVAQQTVVVNEKKFKGKVNSVQKDEEITLGELFEELDTITVSIDDANVTIANAATYALKRNVSSDLYIEIVGAKILYNTENWKDSIVIFTTVGDITITITDNKYCTPTSVTVKVQKADPAFETPTGLAAIYGQTLADVALPEGFAWKNSSTAVGNVGTKSFPATYTPADTANYNTMDVDITITVVKATPAYTIPTGLTATYGQTLADVDLPAGFSWEDSSASVGSVGTNSFTAIYTPTDTENYKTVEVTISVKVNPIPAEKFDIVMNNGDFLHRVGNSGTVALDKLFKAKDGVTVGTISVTIAGVDGSAASGTYSNNAIQFNNTGVVKVTITDNDYCIATELYLEVVNAVNATVATNATANNVVLLNDIGSGFTVSGRYTVYGNGFTLNYTGNGQYLNNGLKQGVVTVSENGTLDNLRIKASIYPSAYLYYGTTQLGDYVQGGPSTVDGDKTRYHYQLSAVAASGNATISNCYIYGGRNNIFINTGDVIVKDTVLECAPVANVQIQSNSTHTVTFENVTTIQYQVNPTIGDTTKVMLGAGILVGPETNDNPAIVLNGEFKQYNWVTSEDANAVSDTKVTKAIIQGALDATAYNHTVNGVTASNLGIIYMNKYDATVKNNTGLPYVLGDVAMKVSNNSVNGKVCSLQGATAEQIYSDAEKADRSTVNGLYQPQFKYSADLGGQYIANTDGVDEYCYREGDTVHVMFPSGATKELDLAALVNIQKYTGQNLNLVITCKDSSGNTVSLTDNKITLSSIEEYTITYTVTDALFYDKVGNVEARDSVSYFWNVTLAVSLKDTKVPDAYYEFDATKQKMGYYKPLIGDVKQYLPFLAGLKIYDYNGQTSYLRFDGDNDFNKVASVTITGYISNEAYIEVTLTDGGVIKTKFLARADSGGASTYTGSIKTSGNTIYFVNGGGTSSSDKTTTAAYWYVDYYKFIGNNGVEITSPQQTFNSTGSSASTPSGSFSTTIKYTVTYDANGGNCGQTTGYATSASAAVTLPTPTRSGYLCVGWYTAASGGTKAGDAGASYTPSANITLYAQWGKPSVVTYDANGGSVSPASAQYQGTALTLPTPTRDGYWCTGWYTAASGGSKIGDTGAAYQATGDITLYAQWSPIYTVTYNANGGSVSPASAEYKGSALTLPMPTKTNSAFVSWNTKQDGKGTSYAANTSYTPTANITLYAQWKDPVTVTYDATTNGGSCGTTSQTYLGTALALPTPVTRTGYTFNGWYTAASGGTKIGAAGASYTPTANITLYAQWTINSYTVNVKTSNASVTGVTNCQTVKYGTTISVTVSFSKDNSKTFTVKNDTTGETILNESAAGTYTFTMPDSSVTINASSTGCFAEGTLITMADGTQKPIEEITYTDELLAWDLHTGTYVVTTPSLIESYEKSETRVINLNFADGTVVRITYDHGLFDVEANNFVFIDERNVASYIGHEFVKVDENGTYTTTELVSYEITVENVAYYTIQTAIYNNCIAEGMFTLTSPPAGVDGWFDYFEIGEGLKYDEEKMQAEIEKYGLYTYEDFAEYVTYEQFIAFNGPYLKVLVGRGVLTYEDILELIATYVN